MRIPLKARWALIPIASFAGCAGTVVGADMAKRILLRVVTPSSLVAGIPPAVGEGVVYAAAAIVFVVAGTWMAPRYRPLVAVVLYAVGAWMAWSQLRDWYIPEGYERAYQRSLLPLCLTLIGGAVGVALSALTWRRKLERND